MPNLYGKKIKHGCDSRSWRGEAGSREDLRGVVEVTDFKGTEMAVLISLQKEQFRHDQRNHSDILCLSKSDRLKHYGLHFAKYVGRLARGSSELKAVEQTITDTALVCLSAANTLHQRLEDSIMEEPKLAVQIDPMRPLADAAGRFADACEKIDHLEEFLPIARQANVDILRWVVSFADDRELDIQSAIVARRKELAERQFYVAD